MNTHESDGTLYEFLNKQVMYSIKYYSIASFDDIKAEWEHLQGGPEMTYFQRYNWYKSLLPYFPEDCKKYESRFVVLYKDNKVKVIAPIFVIKSTFRLINKKGIYLIGYGGWTDYLNFIYYDAQKEDIIYILNDISDHYGCHKFYFTDVPEKTLLYSVIKENYSVEIDEKEICVELKIPDTLDAYMNLLSKNSRQNLRTAKNRIIKLSLSVKYNFDDKEISKKQCEELRDKGLHRKYQKKDIIERIKIKVVVFLWRSFHSDPPFKMDSNSHIMTIHINNELAAFFNYGLDYEHKRIVMMAVGTSD